MKCKFNNAWQGNCKEEADCSGYCITHKDLKCCVCGNQATHSCDETSMLVCGAPLCDDCEHEISEDGTNGGNCVHCKKDEQKYISWIEQEILKENPKLTEEYRKKISELKSPASFDRIVTELVFYRSRLEKIKSLDEVEK